MNKKRTHAGRTLSARSGIETGWPFGMSTRTLPYALGMLLGGGAVAILLEGRPPRRDPDGRSVEAGRAWSLVVLVSILLVSTMVGVGTELLALLFQNRLDARRLPRNI